MRLPKYRHPISTLILSCIIMIANINQAFSKLPNSTQLDNPNTTIELSQNTNKKNKDLWIHIKNKLTLNTNKDTPIAKELNWYKNNPHYFSLLSKQAIPYLYHMVNEVEKRNLPIELALLPIVESSFNPFAYSSAGASGLWQFMPKTALDYDLQQNWWIDDRRNVIKATDAALKYLTRLYKAFGSWELALSAFNSGPGRLQRAIEKNRSLGKPTGIWDLDLPEETTSYVKKLIALSKVIKNPNKFNITLDPIANKPFFKLVKINSQLDISKAASIAQVSIDELYRLNPQLNHWTTPPDGSHQLLVPINKAKKFKIAIDKLKPEERLKWRLHTIKNGESLSKIAQHYLSSINSIKKANRLKENKIIAGKKLIIPIPVTFPKQEIIYTVKVGDSLWSISKLFQVSKQKIKKWNPSIKFTPLMEGIKLTLFIKNKTPKNNKKQEVIYLTKPNDTLDSIADLFHLNSDEIKKWNKLSSPKLKLKQQLILYLNIH